MPSPWHEFYNLLGTAAATLVALLFVAATVAAGLISEPRSAATRTFMTPIIFHYTCVLFLSLMALVPMSELALAGFVTAVALVGVGYSVVVLIGVVHRTADTADRFGYGVLPLAGRRCGARGLLATLLLEQSRPRRTFAAFKQPSVFSRNCAPQSACFLVVANTGESNACAGPYQQRPLPAIRPG